MTKKKKKYKQWSTKHCTKNKTIELHEPHLKLGVNTGTKKKITQVTHTCILFCFENINLPEFILKSTNAHLLHLKKIKLK